jgi:hypothetical protein
MRKRRGVRRGTHWSETRITGLTRISIARIQTLKEEGGGLCERCLHGKHNCDCAQSCTCVCNDVDFPWPPTKAV